MIFSFQRYSQTLTNYVSLQPTSTLWPCPPSTPQSTPTLYSNTLHKREERRHFLPGICAQPDLYAFQVPVCQSVMLWRLFLRPVMPLGQILLLRKGNQTTNWVTNECMMYHEWRDMPSNSKSIIPLFLFFFDSSLCVSLFLVAPPLVSGATTRHRVEQQRSTSTGKTRKRRGGTKTAG